VICLEEEVLVLDAPHADSSAVNILDHELVTAVGRQLRRPHDAGAPLNQLSVQQVDALNVFGI